jgi:hypothetical protein
MTTTLPKSKQLGIHQFGFGGNGGGEALSLITTIYDVGGGESARIKQELALQSYCNSAHFKLISCISTDTLRQVANDLDKNWVLVNAKAAQEKPPAETVLEKHYAILTPDDNLTLETTYFDNGDSAHGLPHGVFTNQRLVLGQAHFLLCGTSIDAATLRKLANELDHFIASTVAI